MAFKLEICCRRGLTTQDRTSYRFIQVTLKKPVGLVLADNKTRTNVIVEEIVPGGNADKSGKVQAGDIISRFTSFLFRRNLADCIVLAPAELELLSASPNTFA